MTFRLLLAAAGIAALTVPAGAQTNSIQRGFHEGSAVGNKAAGPVGGAVGGVMGGAAYGFRSGASKVLGVPEETGSVKKPVTHKKRAVHH